MQPPADKDRRVGSGAGAEDEVGTAALAASTTSAIISNGVIQLGVHPQGHLNVPGGTASSGTGTTVVGLRYLPTGAEATAPGCLCEGWGAADALSGVTGHANESYGGPANLVLQSFASSADSARSTVDIGTTLRVTHDYSPSDDDNLYAVTVSIQNLSDKVVDARYRRVMDWDVEPTAFNEYVTARNGGSPLLRYNNNDGFATADPLGATTAGGVAIVTGDFTDAGPADHGALFDFGFGALDPGETKSFRTFYGAAGSEGEALAALAAVSADVYSLGQPATTDGKTGGGPNTFIFGFGNLGLVGGPLEPAETLGGGGSSGGGDALGAGGGTRYAGGNPSHRHAGQCQEGWPVNCVTGNLWHTFADLDIEGRGPDAHVSRTYNSLAADVDGAFGHGWSSNLTMRIAVDAAGTATVHQETGAVAEFAPTTEGAYTAAPRVLATLVKDSTGYTFTRQKRELFRFDLAGRLLEERDLNGHALVHERDAAGRTVALQDAAGRRVALQHDAAGHVTGLTDPAGRTVAYAYDARGDLTSVTDLGGGVERFGYDAEHRLVTMTDPGGGVVSNTYDAHDRVVEQVDPGRSLTAFRYAPNLTTVTHPNGRVDEHHHLDGLVTELVRGAGTATAATAKYSYDPWTMGAVTATDPNEQMTVREFDRSGNLLSQTDPLGRTTTFTYGPLDEMTSMSGPDGVMSTMTYDAAANPLTVSRPLAGTDRVQRTQLSYGEGPRAGDVTAVTDPTGRTSTFTHDAAGNVVGSTDPGAGTTTYTYDAVGRLTAAVSPRGSLSGALPADHTTRFSYNAYGDLTKQVDPRGGRVERTYDADRNLRAVVDPDGSTTSFSYDADDRLTTVQQPDGTTLRFGYDGMDDTTSQTDGAQQTTHYRYDLHQRLEAVTDPLGRGTSFGYDRAGRRTLTRDAQGQTTSATYDVAGQLTGLDYSDSATPDVAYGYDRVGRRDTMTDGTGTSRYAWDSLGRLTQTTTGAGATVGYAYDLAGRLTKITYPNGKAVTRSHDAAGRFDAVTDWLGGTTRFDYDANSNLQRTTFANGVVSASTHDAADRLMGQTHTGARGLLAGFTYTRSPSGLLTSTDHEAIPAADETYRYTQLDQLSSVATAAGVRSLAYDPAGNITTLLSGSTQTYDVANQARTHTSSTGVTTELSYDVRGNRRNGVDAAGASTTYAYDQANRLVGATRASTGPSTGLLAGGQHHSLAVRRDGTVWSWGGNAQGQLGDGSTSSTSVPRQVPGLVRAVQVSAGALHSAAVADGAVHTWGSNTSGQLGDGTTTTRNGATKVPALTGVERVAAGNYHTLAVDTDAGKVWAWGLNNASQLGDGSTTTRTSPVAVAGLANVVAVAAGGVPGYAGHSVALARDGSVWTWGYGKSGQLGLGTTTSTGTPTKVSGLGGIVAVAAGGDSTYALAGDGQVYAWGDNSYGQLGPSARRAQVTPVIVPISGVRGLAAGGTHAVAVKDDGTVWAWGNNNTGQLGDGGACGKTCTSPVRATGVQGAAVVAGGHVHSLAAIGDGTVRSWGRNAEGQLGDGTTVARLTAVTATGLTQVQPGSGVAQTASYAYDGDGLRTAKTVGGTTQRFTWDLAASVPLLLDDGSTSYVHGPGGLPVEHITSSGAVRYYHHDQIGSTRLLTDSAGAVVATADYDAYGTPARTTGEPVALGFAGEYADAETGLVYLRARYYDPVTAQFLTRDPRAAESGAPYAYADGTPHNATDPTGEIAWFAVAAVVWAVIEIGSAVADAYSTAKTFTDPCASFWDKAGSGGLFAAGVVGPGGGWSTLGRQLDKAPRGRGTTPPDERDSKRLFDEEQRGQLFDDQGGVCARCGDPLPDGWHAHHVERHADGGQTSVDNGAALCPDCHRWIHRKD